LLPGQRVDLAKHAAKWHVSITPVRDAAKQLESQGLIKILPRRGVFVAELTAKELKDIFDVRIALESAAIRLATPGIPAAEAQRALQLYMAARDAASAAQRSRLLPKIDLLIHTLALQHCDNPRLQKAMENMADLVRWCQRTIIARLDEPFLATLPEHIAICEAVCARDPDRAAAAMHSHLSNTLERIQKFLASRGGQKDAGLVSHVAST
jgi:DNA-binding GntR family transcriptional regulator